MAVSASRLRAQPRGGLTFAVAAGTVAVVRHRAAGRERGVAGVFFVGQDGRAATNYPLVVVVQGGEAIVGVGVRLARWQGPEDVRWLAEVARIVAEAGLSHARRESVRAGQGACRQHPRAEARVALRIPPVHRVRSRWEDTRELVLRTAVGGQLCANEGRPARRGEKAAPHRLPHRGALSSFGRQQLLSRAHIFRPPPAAAPHGRPLPVFAARRRRGQAICTCLAYACSSSFATSAIVAHRGSLRDRSISCQMYERMTQLRLHPSDASSLHA